MGLPGWNGRDAVTYCEHAKRKTVTAMDVVYALKSGKDFVQFWCINLCMALADKTIAQDSFCVCQES